MMVETETVSETLDITSILTGWMLEKASLLKKVCFMKLHCRSAQFTMPWATHTEILLKKILAVHLLMKVSNFIDVKRSLP
jgi:hypothetical protein